jgi:hypothetical protein
MVIGERLGGDQPERRIGLVDRADRCQPRRILRRARAVDEAGLAGIAGAGVDLVELDQRPAQEP